MGHVNTDNPKPRAPEPSETPTPQPPDSLEDRIDSLLSEMQESLDEIDRSGETQTSKAPADTPHSAPDEALAAALDDAVEQAEKALDDDQPTPTDQTTDHADAPHPPSKPGAGVLDPELDIEPAGNAEPESASPTTPREPAPGAPATPHASDSGADAPEPIKALDEQLARQAEAITDEPEAIVEHGTPAAPQSPAPGIVDHAHADPAPSAPSQSAPKPKGKPKIAVRKRTDSAETDADAPKGDANAPAPRDDADASSPAPTPKPAAAGASPVRADAPAGILQAMARPLRFVPPNVRDYLGWFGLLTAFNAACVWIFWLLLRA